MINASYHVDSTGIRSRTEEQIFSSIWNSESIQYALWSFHLEEYFCSGHILILKLNELKSWENMYAKDAFREMTISKIILSCIVSFLAKQRTATYKFAQSSSTSSRVNPVLIQQHTSKLIIFVTLKDCQDQFHNGCRCSSALKAQDSRVIQSLF